MPPRPTAGHYVRLSTTLNGSELTAETQQLEARSTTPRFAAYAHLILEMLNSDPHQPPNQRLLLLEQPQIYRPLHGF